MRKVLALFLLLHPLTALAQQPAGWGTYLGTGQAPTQDPFYIQPVLQPPTGPAGYVQASCTLGPGPNKVVVVLGQSLAMNTSNDSYTIANPTHNLTFSAYNGNCYQTKYTMVGTQNNTVFGDACCNSYLGRVGDLLINNNGIQNVVFIPPITNQSLGSTIGFWSNAQQTPYSINNIAVIAHRMAIVGLVPTEIIWEMGTSDGALGTTQAQYTAGLTKIIAAIRMVWPTTPILVNTESFGGTTTYPAIQNAQASFVDNVTIFAGSNTDLIDGSGRYDGLHFNSIGAPFAASLLQAAIVAH